MLVIPFLVHEPFSESQALETEFVEDAAILPYLIVEGYRHPNAKLHGGNSKPPLLPIILFVKFLCSLLPSIERGLLQTFLPASSQGLRVKCLLIGCLASLLVHVYFFNLKGENMHAFLLRV